MFSEQTIMNFSLAQHSMLIAHIDGPVAVVTGNHSVPVRRILLDRRLLRGHPLGAIRPRHTTLTEEGRRVVCVILGYYADVLVGAGILEQRDPVNALRQLRAMRDGSAPAESFVPPETPAEPLQAAET